MVVDTVCEPVCRLIQALAVYFVTGNILVQNNCESEVCYKNDICKGPCKAIHRGRKVDSRQVIPALLFLGAMSLLGRAAA